MSKTYRCSICGKAVPYDGPLPTLHPFCSQRCKLIDLYRWFSEQYTIDRDLTPEDLPDDNPPPGPADS
jgi:endogenous inhibitor of DNA gyrase (YacG/DUF329 family)